MAPTDDVGHGAAVACPDLRGMKHTAAVEAMVEWFLINFEYPAERTPWDEGEYVFIWGALATRAMTRERLWRRSDRAGHRCRCRSHRRRGRPVGAERIAHAVGAPSEP